jgi:hypothetical protein
MTARQSAAVRQLVLRGIPRPLAIAMVRGLFRGPYVR